MIVILRKVSSTFVLCALVSVSCSDEEQLPTPLADLDASIIVDSSIPTDASGIDDAAVGSDASNLDASIPDSSNVGLDASGLDAADTSSTTDLDASVPDSSTGLDASVIPDASDLDAGVLDTSVTPDASDLDASIADVSASTLDVGSADTSVTLDDASVADTSVTPDDASLAVDASIEFDASTPDAAVADASTGDAAIGDDAAVATDTVFEDEIAWNNRFAAITELIDFEAVTPAPGIVDINAFASDPAAPTMFAIEGEEVYVAESTTPTYAEIATAPSGTNYLIPVVPTTPPAAPVETTGIIRIQFTQPVRAIAGTFVGVGPDFAFTGFAVPTPDLAQPTFRFSQQPSTSFAFLGVEFVTPVSEVDIYFSMSSEADILGFDNLQYVIE